MPRARTGVTSGSTAATLGGLRALRAELSAELDSIQSKLAAVDTLLGAGVPRIAVAAPVAGRRPAGGGKTPTGRDLRSGSLKDFIQRVLARGGVMAVKDITDEVIASGYRSKNKTLAKSVGIALAEMSNVAKVARGRFKLK